LVAAAGAQAADLPVKAKPVEYVKVCSLYGAGFWYVPGTDTCLKIGSYVRVQTSYNAEGGGIPLGANDSGTETAGRQTRTDTSNLAMRVRAAVSVDLRTQTEYGTLRSYLEIGQQLTTNNSAAVDSPFFDRGFIQFAGFTAGKIRSYFDINSFAPYSYANSRISGDTGAAGIYGIAYTAQFGNGVTASLSFEDGGSGSNGNSAGSAGSRGHLVKDLNVAGSFNPATGTVTYDNRGWQYPDVVGALRIDQAWGYAQVAAALHDASGGYYTGPGVDACGTSANCVTLGHPGTATGWAVTGGFTLNNVLGLKGDQFGMQAAYANGATGYVTRATGPWVMYDGNTAGIAASNDGVYINGSGIELTTTWGINGFYQHFWNPRWRTSLHGGYIETDFDNTAKSFYCPTGAGGNPVTGISNVTIAGTGGTCNPDHSWWVVGTRTQWNPHPDLDIGLEVLWTHLNTAFKGGTITAAAGAQPPGAVIDDQDVLSVYFRIQRNFLP
ncbi:MAG TPA: porin, partial [Xanthobacteraceae bacterium]|nr:porin [Xanthobacteraceae bacterium]